MTCPNCEKQMPWWRVYFHSMTFSLKCPQCETRFYIDLAHLAHKKAKPMFAMFVLSCAVGVLFAYSIGREQTRLFWLRLTLIAAMGLPGLVALAGLQAAKTVREKPRPQLLRMETLLGKLFWIIGMLSALLFFAGAGLALSIPLFRGRVDAALVLCFVLAVVFLGLAQVVMLIQIHFLRGADREEAI